MAKKKKKDKKKPWDYGRRYGGSNKSGSNNNNRKEPFNPSKKDDKKKGKKSSSGSKKVKKAAKRITSSLQMQRDQGDDRARQIRNKHVEKSPRNIGDTNRGKAARQQMQKRTDQLMDRREYNGKARGVPNGLDGQGVRHALGNGKHWGANDQRRYDAYMRRKGVDPLKADSIVDPDRFGPLADQYKQGMNTLGNDYVKGFTEQLKFQQDEMRAHNQREKEMFLGEIANNHAMMRELQAQNTAAQQQMQAQQAADQRFRAEQLYQQNLMIQQQREQAAAAQALQQEQARKSDNLSRAYVPEANEGLGSVAYGDTRTSETMSKKRKDKNNTISSLRMNTGLAKPSSSTAGLQLA